MKHYIYIDDLSSLVCHYRRRGDKTDDWIYVYSLARRYGNTPPPAGCLEIKDDLIS
jgi:hypothetical protein